MFGKVIELKENNTPSAEGNKVKGDAYTTRLLREWSRLHVENGLLYRKRIGQRQLMLPATYKQTALTYLHNHMGPVGKGVEKVVSLARKQFSWPCMKREIEEYLTRKCPCLKQKS